MSRKSRGGGTNKDKAGGLPPSFPQENNPEHRAFLIRSLERNDVDLTALLELNRSLRKAKEYILSTCGELVLLDLGQGRLTVINDELHDSKKGATFQDDGGDQASSYSLSPKQKELCIDFLLRMKLRRKLLNRLSRRLNRVAHAMDGEDVAPPAPPKYGDLRLNIDPGAVKAYVDRWEKQDKAKKLLVEEKERRRVEEYKTKLEAQEKAGIEEKGSREMKEGEIDKTPTEEQTSEKLDQGIDQQGEKPDNPSSDVVSSRVRPEKFAAFSSPPQTISSVLSEDLRKVLQEFDSCYERKWDPTKPSSGNNVQYTILEAPMEEDHNAIKYGAGIGAANSSMSAREREAEYKRWQTALLNRVPDQPTFEDLGMKDRVFHLEGRRKRALEEVEDSPSKKYKPSDRTEDDEDEERVHKDDSARKELNQELNAVDANELAVDKDKEKVKETEGDEKLNDDKISIENARKEEDISNFPDRQKVQVIKDGEDANSGEPVKSGDVEMDMVSDSADTKEVPMDVDGNHVEMDTKHDGVDNQTDPDPKIHQSPGDNKEDSTLVGTNDRDHKNDDQENGDLPGDDKMVDRGVTDNNEMSPARDDNNESVESQRQVKQDGDLSEDKPLNVGEGEEEVAVEDTNGKVENSSEKNGEEVNTPAEGLLKNEEGIPNEETDGASKESRDGDVSVPKAESLNPTDNSMGETEEAGIHENTEQESKLGDKTEIVNGEDGEEKVDAKTQGTESDDESDMFAADSDSEQKDANVEKGEHQPVSLDDDDLSNEGKPEDSSKIPSVMSTEEDEPGGQTDPDTEHPKIKIEPRKEFLKAESNRDIGGSGMDGSDIIDLKGDSGGVVAKEVEDVPKIKIQPRKEFLKGGGGGEKEGLKREKENQNDEEKKEEPKRKKPISFVPVPSFHEQDLRRIKMIHGDLLATSIHEHARRRLAEVTMEYNKAFRVSNEAYDRRQAVQQQLTNYRYESRTKMSKLKNDYALQVAIAKKRWEKKKREHDSKQLRRAMPSRWGQQPIGTNKTQRYVAFGGLPTIIGTCIGDVVDVAIMNFEGKLPKSEFDEFVPPPAPDMNQVVNAQTGETISQEQQRIEGEFQHKVNSLNVRLQNSEEERKRAWKKMLKTKAEFDVPHVYQTTASTGLSRRSNIKLDLNNYHMVPLPALRTSAQQVMPRELAAARASLPSYTPPGESESKYSAARVRERISADGSVAPVTEPKKTKEGLYQRPAGRTRKGMQWDALKGIWKPLMHD